MKNKSSVQIKNNAKYNVSIDIPSSMKNNKNDSYCKNN